MSVISPFPEKIRMFRDLMSIRMCNNMDKISSYETLFIVDVQQGEDNVKALVEKFTGLIAANGTI